MPELEEVRPGPWERRGVLAAEAEVLLLGGGRRHGARAMDYGVSRHATHPRYSKEGEERTPACNAEFLMGLAGRENLCCPTGEQMSTEARF